MSHDMRFAVAVIIGVAAYAIIIRPLLGKSGIMATLPASQSISPSKSSNKAVDEGLK